MSQFKLGVGTQFSFQGTAYFGGTTPIHYTATAQVSVPTPTSQWTAYAGSMADEILAVTGGTTSSNPYLQFTDPSLTGLGAPGGVISLAIWADPSDNLAYNNVGAEDISYSFSSTIPAGASFLLWDPGAGGYSGSVTFSLSASAGGSVLSTSGWHFSVEDPFGHPISTNIAVNPSTGLVTVSNYTGSDFPNSVIIVTTNAPIDHIDVNATTIPFDFWGLAFNPTQGLSTHVAPTVTAVSSVSVAENQSIAASSLIASISNPSGDKITLDIFNCRSVWPPSPAPASCQPR